MPGVRGEADEERLCTAPQGVDPARAGRQAAIDRAGGLKPFAARAGVSPHAAGRGHGDRRRVHRDRRPIPRRQARPDHLPITTARSLHLSGEGAEVFVTAYAIEDTETQRDLLSDQISVQVLPDWGGRPGRTMTVEVIETIRIHG